MNSSRKISDIRSTSSDARYAGVVFENCLTGSIDEAIAQAKAQPDFGAINNGRKELEIFLRVKRAINWAGDVVASWDLAQAEEDRDSLIPVEQ
jgi:hypothetical protein